MDAKKISISVGKKQLAAAKQIAKREGLSLSAVFMRGVSTDGGLIARRIARITRSPSADVYELRVTAPNY